MRWIRPSSPPTVPEGQRIYAIGDVHGRYDLLVELISAILQSEEARTPAQVTLILLGDLIDRGPASAEVIALAQAGVPGLPKPIVLKGNHEDIMAAAWHGDLNALVGWLQFGGVATLASFGVDHTMLAATDVADIPDLMRRTIPEPIIRWIDELPLRHQVGDYLFVHAGVRPGIPIERQDEHDLLWIRDEFLGSRRSHGAVVVHGHSIHESPQQRRNRIGIDTGAYHSGHLTALCLEGETQTMLVTQGAPGRIRLRRASRLPAAAGEAIASNHGPNDDEVTGGLTRKVR